MCFTLGGGSDAATEGSPGLHSGSSQGRAGVSDETVKAARKGRRMRKSTIKILKVALGMRGAASSIFRPDFVTKCPA